MRGEKSDKFILWFDELCIDDVPTVGGKNASLGEMYRNLSKQGVRIPNGFAVTAYAYFHLLEKAGIRDDIRKILKGLNTHKLEDLADRGHKVRELIRHAEFPKELVEAIHAAYKKLCKLYGKRTDVAVRSSATAEDLPDASFAGQQETFLNIKGEMELINACKKCFASLFTNRAISYRVDKGFDHFKVGLSIGVQKMVRSDLASSGVMFSIDTETGFKEAIVINGAWGLGETVVQGAVNPDEFYVFKPTLKKGFKPILQKNIGKKEIKMIYAHKVGVSTKTVPTTNKERRSFVLNDNEIMELAEWATVIEDHYSAKAGHFKPMDMEWAKDGQSGKLFIVQARPETVHSQKDSTKLKRYHLKQKGKVLTQGNAVGDLIGQGKANIIKDASHITKFKKGEVLVTRITDPDWEPIMKIAGAIVTEKGGRTSHAAIVSRELGVPCIVGTGNATTAIKQGQKITADCSSGETGYVYDKFLKFNVEEIDLKTIPKTKTKIMMNLGNPEQAFEKSFFPNDGVGLAREEFIINSYIRIHPRALIEYDKLKDKNAKKLINELTHGYDNKEEYFVDKLAQGISMLSAAFYPKKVIIRLSDFKSNEYANLIGGDAFEPDEENPMIGWRGASRYYSQEYEKAFSLECKALKKVREEMGLKNLVIMVPFCRTPEEGEKVLEVMKRHGLKQGKDGLEVYAMCEIPSNVILAEDFLDIFDGFSIGSNDLTQLTLGIDRDSSLVSHIYDERNKAVKLLVKRVIATAKKKGKYIGICGDAPSSFPEFAAFLVDCGIESMSLTPDAILKTFLVVEKVEKNLKK
jgi:pyruvate, water dikinase